MHIRYMFNQGISRYMFKYFNDSSSTFHGCLAHSKVTTLISAEQVVLAIQQVRQMRWIVVFCTWQWYAALAFALFHHQTSLPHLHTFAVLAWWIEEVHRAAQKRDEIKSASLRQEMRSAGRSWGFNSANTKGSAQNPLPPVIVSTKWPWKWPFTPWRMSNTLESGRELSTVVPCLSCWWGHG